MTPLVARPESPRRAILIGRQRARIENVSRTGCRLQAQHPLAIGAIGLLSVDIDGQSHLELFRVSRTSGRSGADDLYKIGVEFLPLIADAASLHQIVGQLDRSDAT